MKKAVKTWIRSKMNAEDNQDHFGVHINPFRAYMCLWDDFRPTGSNHLTIM